MKRVAEKSPCGLSGAAQAGAVAAHAGARLPAGVTKLAAAVEARLQADGMCLTMGGEPTFIPERPEGSEWSTEAMGPQKLGYARRFAAELVRTRFKGALVMQVFGKWYPGEVLPRWNLLTLAKRDQSPFWPVTKALHLDDIAGSNAAANAGKFIRALAQQLNLSAHVFPAYEQESSGDTIPTGYVLPLDCDPDGTWRSDDWGFGKDKRMELFMGDSPIGLRIPLYQLPDTSLKRALTVEILNGALAIFLPPLLYPAFCNLIDQIAVIVAKLRLRHIEFCGYGPEGAGDALHTIGLAADPGVLEVNLPVCPQWQDYHEILTTVYAAAQSVGMVATKRQLNGAIHGTGGGSHLAFGGLDSARNPFLAQPARIASLLRYWQRHPVLSYGFTGLYVGPGSQAPRVDEGPVHGLYELEVACEGISRLLPWSDGGLIDQFLRNLLTDSAGNTHRAEICFDKFANPLTGNGKLGIIELRAFETQPNATLSSLVALFVRTVIARLSLVPCAEDLCRFGPELHDRYFLPTYLWRDLECICADLAAAGFDFKSDWLRPAFDFRFPVVGRLPLPNGGCLEVRQALESWPLMAEESRGTATVRVVDNSTDRLQLRLDPPELATAGRLLVNGVEIPFGQDDGIAVRGLRYKCASAYPALHPHVPIQSPLRFEWLEPDSDLPLVAADYFYWNPFGPVYDGAPATAAEAAQRRTERWQLIESPLAGARPVRAAPSAPEFRHTVDLRRLPPV